MNIHISYMAQMRRLARKSSEQVTLDGGSRVIDLLRRLAEIHGPGFQAVALDAAGNGHASLLVFRSEEQISQDTPLAHGDRITLLTPMAGG